MQPQSKHKKYHDLIPTIEKPVIIVLSEIVVGSETSIKSSKEQNIQPTELHRFFMIRKGANSVLLIKYLNKLK
jgi:hypothetical protein